MRSSDWEPPDALPPDPPLKPQDASVMVAAVATATAAPHRRDFFIDFLTLEWNEPSLNAKYLCAAVRRG
ncbi:hypothetical protein GCM10009617_05040 [Leifsonia poae]|uniref:Uncharacterized protein n=1 Tax=Leifsonia poae TaxID=110933 RepID=A0A9W6H6M5_9MICO|nr:hypothetical protein GCM10017584_05040 [Leifsonia poae]